MKHPLIIAHRGLGGPYTENTLSAFQHALECGVDGIEVDIHLTFDKQLVVHHDFALNLETTRDTNGSWIQQPLAVSTLTLKELQSFDIGRLKPDSPKALNYPHITGQEGAFPPSLKQVLALIKDRTEYLWIDIKSQDFDNARKITEYVQVLLTELKDFPRPQAVRLMSFDWKVLEYIRLTDPSWNIAYLTGHLTGKTLKDLPLGADVWNADFKQLSMPLVQQAYAQDIRVASWTLNTAQTIQDALRMGIFALTTDFPCLAKEIIKEASF